MKKIKSRRLRSVGLFIVLVALIVSYVNNGFESKAPVQNTREADRVYEELSHTKKVQINVSVRSLELMRKVINTKLEPTGAIKLYSEEQGGSGLYIYQVDSQNIPILITDIKDIGSISKQNEKVNTQDIEIDLEAKLRDREAIYQKEFQDYNNSKTKYSYQLDRLKLLGKEIDSLKFEISNQKNKAMTLLYIRANTSSSRVGKVRNYQKFVYDFIKYMIIFTIVIAFLYYGTVLLVYLLAMLGIKFPTLTGYGGRGYNDYAGYKGYRGYGSYGGGYSYGGNKKRRIKRIYRNKKSSDGDIDESEEN